MARFTDSPYEYMMTQKPGAMRGRGAGPPRRPEKEPLQHSENELLQCPGTRMQRSPVKMKCEACPYGRGRPCVGVCMKKILSSVMEKKRGQNEADT